MRHPLISPDTVVANDADFKGGATIITGSNCPEELLSSEHWV